MHMLARAVGLLMVIATTSIAQRPGAPPGDRPGNRPGDGPGPGRGIGMMMPGGPGRGPAGGPVGATADFLLAHTGDLALTDAQVVRLAAISRRADARRKTMMTRLDSARAAARPAPGDSAGPRGRGPRPPMPDAAEMQKLRDQLHADVRDAIAVLTPDQQATAWMMVAGGPPPGGPALGAGPGGVDRGPISRPPAPRDVPRRPDENARTEP